MGYVWWAYREKPSYTCSSCGDERRGAVTREGNIPTSSNTGIQGIRRWWVKINSHRHTHMCAYIPEWMQLTVIMTTSPSIGQSPRIHQRTDVADNCGHTTIFYDLNRNRIMQYRTHPATCTYDQLVPLLSLTQDLWPNSKPWVVQIILSCRMFKVIIWDIYTCQTKILYFKMRIIQEIPFKLSFLRILRKLSSISPQLMYLLVTHLTEVALIFQLAPKTEPTHRVNRGSTH